MSDFRYSDDNFDEPEPISNKPETIWGIIISFMILSWICVCLRLYVRTKIVRAPGWDDLCVGLYLLTVTAGSIATCVSVTYGLANATYVTSTALIKEALLLQYLRVFGRAACVHRLLIALIIFTALWGFAYSFLAWVPCVPVYDFWVGGAESNCYGYGSQYVGPFAATFESHAAINMVLDTAVLIIPLPLLFRGETTAYTRVRLAGLLSMGVFVLVFAIWRLATLVAHQVATRPTRDPTWYGAISIILAALEVNAASICASVPIFWPILKDLDWGIFVTQEVKITREMRYAEDEEDRLTHNTAYSRAGSETDLGECGGRKGLKNKEDHYQDSYVLSQVDPFRPSVDRVQASARSDMAKRGSRKWMKL